LQVSCCDESIATRTPKVAQTMMQCLRFWATVCKTVRAMLSDRCLSCPVSAVLSVCNVGVLWPNGWTDQNETWHAGRPSSWPHCIRWGPSSLSPKGGGAPPLIFGHICCGQMAAGITMPLGTEVGFSPGDFMLDGDPATPRKRHTHPPNFWPMYVATVAHLSYWLLSVI